MAESMTEKKKRALRIVTQLIEEYPNATSALDYSNPLQCLVATILSAQCTDVRVNMVTPALFERYKTAADFAEADSGDLEEMIRSTGFFRNKAKSIRNASRAIVADHGGVVPDTMEELLTLDGVGRKTANCVLGNAYNQPAVMVDTHVKRLTWRMGLTEHTNPDHIEMDIKALFPEELWMPASHALIYHGRNKCKARKPGCDTCSVAVWCPKRPVQR